MKQQHKKNDERSSSSSVSLLPSASSPPPLSLALRSVSSSSAFALARRPHAEGRWRHAQIELLADQVERAWNVTEEAVESSAPQAMEWFTVAEMTLLALHNQSQARTHAGATVRWHSLAQGASGLRLSLWTDRAALAFQLDGQQFELRFRLPPADSFMMFVHEQQCVLRIVLPATPSVYRMAEGTFRRAMAPTPTGDQRFARCGVIDLLFSSAEAQRVSSCPTLQLAQHKAMLSCLPTPLSDLRPMMGWSEYDSELSRVSFTARYLLHCLLAAGRFHIPTPNVARQLAQTIAQADASFVHTQLDTLIAEGAPVQVTDLLTSLAAQTIGSGMQPGAAATAVARHVFVTPLRVLPQRPELECGEGNRILRQYAQFRDRFIRVTFVEETLSPLSPAAVRDLQDSWLRPIMRDGLVVAGNRYIFLAYSNSQLRQHTAYFYCESHGGFDNEDALSAPPTAAAIRAGVGNLSHIATPGKAAARLAQAFSSTKQTIRLQAHQVTHIEDVCTADGSLCFTDGAGLISRRLAAQVTERWDTTLKHTPSAFQFRYRGAKGVLQVCPATLEGSLLKVSDVALRPSQIKFEGNQEHTELEVCAIATIMPFYLNRAIIPVLRAGGVEPQVFFDLFTHCSAEMHAARHDSTLALELLRTHARHHHDIIRLLESGYDIRSEPYLRSFIGCVIDKLLVEMCSRFRLPIAPLAARLMGVADETSTLQPGTVFFQARDPTRKLPAAGTRLAVGRDPCLHPGDIRVLTMADPPPNSPLRDLFEVLIFSVRGSRPEANKMGGGDLDGDVFFVIWDQRFVPKGQHEPMQYDTPQPAAKIQASAASSAEGRQQRAVESAATQISDFFVSFMQSSSVGAIADAHAALADQSPLGVLDPACLRLCELHSAAVDFAKTGVSVALPRMLQPRAFPNWMNRTPMGNAHSVLSQLFTKGQALLNSAVSSASTASPAAQISPSLRLPSGFQRYSEDAIQHYHGYCSEVAHLLRDFDLHSDVQLFSGLSATHLRLSKARAHGTTALRLDASMRELKLKYLRIFQQGLSEAAASSQNCRMKAAAWYHAAYSSKAAQPCLSFAWIAVEAMCLLGARAVETAPADPILNSSLDASVSPSDATDSVIDKALSLYRQGEFTLALTAYEDAWLRSSAELQSRVCIGRAECLLALHQPFDAMIWCEHALRLPGESDHFAHARILLSQAHALILTPSEAAGGEATLQRLFEMTRDLILHVAHSREHKATAMDAHRSASVLSALQRLPWTRKITSLDSIRIVRNAKELQVLSEGGLASAILVLQPGEYDALRTLEFHQDVMLIGDQRKCGVRLKSGLLHAVTVYLGTCVLSGIQVVQGVPHPQYSAVCVMSNGLKHVSTGETARLGPARLLMVDCAVQQYDEVGVLADGDDVDVTLMRCSFVRIGKQAVEVRRGASLTMLDCTLSQVGYNGINCYAGAKRLRVVRTLIDECKQEGILAAGSLWNAPSLEQEKWRKKLGLGSDGTPLAETAGMRISEEAQQWARLHGGALEVSIEQCTIQRCGRYGLSCDHSVLFVDVSACIFKHNRPCKVLIKGEVHARISACHFVHGSRPGVQIGFNYDALVHVRHNAFVGETKQAIVNELEVRDRMSALLEHVLQARTNPPVLEGNLVGCDLDSLVSVADLQLRCPVLNRLRPGEPDSAHVPLSQACSWSRRVLRYDADAEYYAIGNTFGHSLLPSSLPPPTSRRITLMLAQARDIRHIVTTAPDLQTQLQRGDTSHQEALFVLQEECISLLARIVLLLRMIADGATTAIVLPVWSNVLLTQEEHTVVKFHLRRLASGDFPHWLRVPSITVLTRLRAVFEEWSTCSVSKAAVEQARQQIPDQLTVTSLMYTIRALATQHGGRLDWLPRRAADQLKAYSETGSFPVSVSPLLHANPTMLESPALRHNLYFSSSIFRAVRVPTLMQQVAGGAAHTWLAAQLCATLEPQFAATRALLLSGRCCVGLLHDHMRDLAFELPRFYSVVHDDAEPMHLEEGIDRADFGNYCDYDSLLATLLLASQLLKADASSALMIHSHRWHKLNPIACLLESTPAALLATRIVRQACGFHPSTAPALLRLRLLHSSRSCHHSETSAPGVLHMTWQRTEPAPMAESQVGPVIAAQTVRFLSAPWRRSPALSSFLSGAGAAAVMRCMQCMHTHKDSPATDLLSACNTSLRENNLHAAELRTLAALQSFDPLAAVEDAVLLLRFTCRMPLLELKLNKESPVQVVLSRTPAPEAALEGNGRAAAAVCWLSSAAVLQLFDSLSFDSRSMEVQLFLLHSELRRYRSMFLTLCAVSDTPLLEGQDRSDLKLRCAVLAPSAAIAAVCVVDDFTVPRWLTPGRLALGSTTEPPVALQCRRSWNRAKELANEQFAKGHIEPALDLYAQGLLADNSCVSKLLMHLSCCACQLHRPIDVLRYALTLCAVDESCIAAWLLVQQAVQELQKGADSGGSSSSGSCEWFALEACRRSASCPSHPLHDITRRYPTTERLLVDSLPGSAPKSASSQDSAVLALSETISLLQFHARAPSSAKKSASATVDLCSLLQQGENKVQQCEWNAAYECLHTAVSNNSTCARAVLLTNRAQCFAKLSGTGTAVNRLLSSTAAVLLSPSSAKSYLRQAEALAAVQRRSLAMEACRQGAALPEAGSLAAELTLLQRSLRTVSTASAASSSSSSASGAPSMPHVPRSSPRREDVNTCSEAGTDASSSLQEARAMREAMDLMSRAFGVEEKVLADDPMRFAETPRFDKETIRAVAWPLGIDVRKCSVILTEAFEKASWQRMDELSIALPDDQVLKHISTQDLPLRLGCPTEQRFQWWLTAPPRTVQFAHDVAAIHLSKTCLSFPNHAFRPLIMAAGKVNVVTGTRHADLSALCVAEGIPAFKASAEPTRFVGFGPHAACVAKSLIIIHMLSSTPLSSSSSVSSSSPPVSAVVHAVVEIWFSASLQRSSMQLLRKAMTEILEQQAKGIRKHEPAVIQLMQEWQATHIPLQQARERWLEHRPLKSVARAANLKLPADRIAFCCYALCGDVYPATSDSVGNPCMFVTAPGWTRDSDESIFDRVALAALLQKREFADNILVAAAECLRSDVEHLHQLLSSGAVHAEFRLGSLLDARSATARSIRQLQPWTIWWSNACDHMSPRAFHELARASSAAEDTIHTAISLNWTRDVKGSWIFDWPSVEYRKEIMRLTRSFHKRIHQGSLAHGMRPLDRYLLPPIDHMMNLSAPMLASQLDTPWREAFFSPANIGGDGYVQAPSGSFEQLPYNAMGSRSTQMCFTFSYDRSVRMQVAEGRQLCSNPSCTQPRACEKPTIVCQLCYAALYCCVACQQQHRKQHQAQCKPFKPL